MSAPAPSRTRRHVRIRQVARELLGYERLRPGQAEAIDAVLSDRDTLVVLATGQGKSAIYQVAGMQLEGPTIIVSPLLALQRDQVNSIEESTLTGAAAALNSTASNGEVEDVLRRLEIGELEFLFLAPEQFENPETLARIAAAEPSLFVVDEAHCVSDWGHDFRPSYLRLKPVIEALGGPVILALTATASPPIRQEIIERLGMEDPAVIVRGFDRPNIRFEVRDVLGDSEKQAAVIEDVLGRRGSGIVYTATRQAAETLATELEKAGETVLPYHAGLSRKRREEAERAFLDGDVRMMVATVAFGMGIDKPDIRFVVHADISGSLDAYYQEVGRAGRDGLAADALLYYRAEDLGLRSFFGHVPELTRAEIRRVVKWAGSGPKANDTAGLSAGKFRSACNLLTTAGFCEFLADGGITPVSGREADAIEAALAAQERRIQFERSRLEMLRSYAETRSCRREFLLSYFGDVLDSCDNCDNCLGVDATEVPAAPAEPLLFAPGARVQHATFGIGQVLRCAADRVTVLFDEAGYKTLALALVAEGTLLQV